MSASWRASKSQVRRELLGDGAQPREVVVAEVAAGPLAVGDDDQAHQAFSITHGSGEHIADRRQFGQRVVGAYDEFHRLTSGEHGGPGRVAGPGGQLGQWRADVATAQVAALVEHDDARPGRAQQPGHLGDRGLDDLVEVERTSDATDEAVQVVEVAEAFSKIELNALKGLGGAER